MTAVEIVASQLRTAARFSEGEASLDEVLGTMLAAAAWIVAHPVKASTKRYSLAQSKPWVIASAGLQSFLAL